MRIKILTLTILSCLLSLSVQAEEWIDVTKLYITNPSYDDNSKDGWTISASAGSTTTNYTAQEFWNGTWNIYQTANVPNGHYRLSVNAFYRPGSNSNSAVDEYESTEIPCVLYANQESTPVKSVYSSSLSENYDGNCWGYTTGGGGGGWGGWGGTVSAWYPNGMSSGSYCFAQGQYVNQLEFDVADGSLTFGIMNQTYASSNWCMMDNWTLEYYGTKTLVTTITLPKTVEIALGGTQQLSLSYNPTNATFPVFTWESDDPDIATVDANGNVQGVASGTTAIRATAEDGSGVTAECQVTVTFNGATAASVQINEIMSDNVDMFVDPSWNYGGWVELYNPTNQDVSVGHYWLGNKASHLMKAQIPYSVGNIPAHGYRVLWFDHADVRKDISENWENTQIDMKLDCEGDTLFLSDENGNLITSQVYPQAVMRTSYARRSENSQEWSLTATPTPGASNAGSAFATEQLAAPEVDQPSQLMTGGLTVNVTYPAGATLRYTTDGSTPTLSNGETSADGIFSVDASTVYRFRCFKDGSLPSNVVTRSYILQDKDYYLPVVSIVTDPQNLYSDSIGIYVTGVNGKTANQDGTKRNFNMEWDRPASIEFFNDDKNVDGYFAQEADICISGGWSRKYEPRSFKIKAGKVYDLKNTLDYAFFPDKPYNRNKALLLRNGGNDEYNQTRLKDAALQEVARVSEFPLNLQSYRPVHVFINGQYLAMLNLREPSNKHYAFANYGIDTDDCDAFEMSVDSGYVQTAGTREAFDQWYTLAQNAGDEMAYEQLCDLVDIDDYTNYMAFKFFLNDWDWPHNNTKAFRQHTDGKFHFMVYDLDNCVDRSGNNIFSDFASKQIHTFYSRPEYNWTSLTKEVEMVTIFLNMLQNESFKKKFIDTYCVVGGSVFGDEDELKSTVYNLADHISTALSWEGHSPYGSGRSFTEGIISAITGSYRATMTSVLKAYNTFGLSDTETQAVQLSNNVEGAAISVNGINVPRSKFNGYLFAPVTLSASAPAGYQFAGWYSPNGSTTTTTVAPEAGQWKYYEGGSLDNTGWQSSTYDESGWTDGTAPFGYGNSGKYMAGATTTLSKTDASGNRIPTYYLRRHFTLDKAPADGETYTLNYDVDDGMIAYLNGTEVGLYHMWSGATYDQTCQSNGDDWYEGDTPYSGTIDLDNSVLKKGENVLAIEVHNCNSTSSDIWLEASIAKTTVTSGEATLVSKDATMTMPATGTQNLVATYDVLPDDSLLAQNITPIRINEVSADNTVDVDDYYKKDDWVELYNTTSEDIDLAGMYLTDKKTNHHKYQIPSNLPALADGTPATLIKAHGYKVVWCSKREQQGAEIHANFKLDNEDGKMVRIEAADGSWADSLVYCKHEGDQSVGRYTDGSNQVYLMKQTTIGAANVLDSYAEIWEYVPEDPKPTAIAQTTGRSTLRQVQGYYSLSGMLMGRTPAALPNGIYVVKYADGSSRKVSIRK